MKDIMSIIDVDCANMVKTLVIENIDQIMSLPLEDESCTR